jgi:O-antigen/teichoic acid export membrane protein
MSGREMREARLTLRGRVLLHSGIQLLGRTGNALGGLVLLWLLTRYLGPAGFGRYTFVSGYIGLFYVITDPGLSSVATREMSRRLPERARIAGTMLSTRLLFAGLAFVAAVVVLHLAPTTSFKQDGVVVAALIMGLGLLLAPATGTAQAVCQVALRMGAPSLADAVTRWSSLVGVAALYAAGAAFSLSPAVRLDAVVVCIAAGFTVGGAVAVAGAWRIVRVLPVWDVRLAISLMRDALPVALVSVVGLIHYRIDVVILTTMSTMTAVGRYGVAVKLVDVSLAGLGMFLGVAFPILSRRASEDRVALQRAFQKAFDLILILGLGIAVSVSVLAPRIVQLLSGSHFGGAAEPLAVIAWAVPITFVETLFSQMVIAANRQLRAVPIIAVATALNIGLNIVLIPHLGPTAPALVTDISDGIATAGLLAVLFGVYGFGPNVSSFARICVAGLATYLVMYMAGGAGFIPVALLGGCVYLGSLALLRVAGPADLRALLHKAADDPDVIRARS